ncbi:MAG: bifunctional metallophosphatase/5'-nucleotidase [Anaerolineae bacterium]|nr:bifunctional metallophosphatase/5'-nucleotidase [Anaerolineae bacterium]
MSLMGYDAMALGPRELSLGVDLLRQRMGEASFPILSANAVLAGSQDLVAEPYTILDVSGYKIGVIGLTRAEAAAPSGFQVLDPQQAAERYVPEVHEKADTVILLTNLEYNAALALARVVPGIDLLVGALPSQFPTQSVRAPDTGTLVVVADLATTGHSGRRVGVLLVTLGSDGSVTGEFWSARWIDKGIPDDPDMQALLGKYQ